MAVFLVSAISLFSFCATSVYRYTQGENINVNKSFRTKLPQEVIIEKFKEKNIPLNGIRLTTGNAWHG
ncbi:MAG: hypothetical protein WDO16_00180 [Bacteroidota bacterium]